MRRLVSIASLAFLLSAILMVFAVPSFATEADDHATDEMSEMDDADHAEEAELMDESEHAEDAAHEADEEGQWTGTLGALVAGVLLAGLAFGMSGVDGLGEGDH